MNTDICNLFRAIVLPDDEKHKMIPQVEGEKHYFLRFITTYFPDFIYMTSFNDYYYTMKNYDMDFEESGRIENINYNYISDISQLVNYADQYAFIYNVLGKYLSIIIILAKYENELSDKQYNDFLECTFDIFLSNLVKKAMNTDEFLIMLNSKVILSLTEDYFRINKDKVGNLLEFVQRYPNIRDIMIPISITLSIENDDSKLFTELLELWHRERKLLHVSQFRKDSLLKLLYVRVTETVAKTEKLDYLLYFLSNYGNAESYLYTLVGYMVPKVILTALTGAKIAFKLSNEELVDRTFNYPSSYTFEALRELGVPLETIRARGSEKMLRAMSSLDV